MIEIDAKTRLIYAERKSDALTLHAMQEFTRLWNKVLEKQKKRERMNKRKRERGSSHRIASIAETIEWWL